MSGAPTTFQCRHDSCSYRKRVWKDRRSRNVHEASTRFHKCPTGCYRCDTKDAASPKELGQALCPHDGCNRLYNRRHMRAHMANEKLHRLQCTPGCEECTKQGWESMGAAAGQYHVPLPAAASPQAGGAGRRLEREREHLKLDDGSRLDGRPAPSAAAVAGGGQLQEAIYMQTPISSFDRAAVERFQLPVEPTVSPQRPDGQMLFLPSGAGLEHVRWDSLLAGGRASLFKSNLLPQERAELSRRREEALVLLARATGCDDAAMNLSFLMTSMPASSEAYKAPPANGTPSQSLLQGLETIMPSEDAADANAAAAGGQRQPPTSGTESH